MQISRSTTDSEATAMAMTLTLVDYVKALRESMCMRTGPGVIKCDTKAAIVLSTGEGTWKTKTLANRVAWIRESVDAGEISVEYIPTREQRADGLAKDLSGPLHRNGVAGLSLSPLMKPEATLSLCRANLCRVRVSECHYDNTVLERGSVGVETSVEMMLEKSDTVGTWDYKRINLLQFFTVCTF